MEVDPRFLKGLELFNNREFYECHEVIENLWLETSVEKSKSNEYRDLYKGVIQAAAALYQFQRGILGGAYRLYKSAIGYMEKYELAALGLDVHELIQDLHRCFSELHDVAKKESRGPVVEVHFPKKINLSKELIPTIHFKT